jgi:membrane protease YdiL (CAAX protease family)
VNALAAKRAPRKPKREPAAVRYAFYSVLVALVASMPVLTALYLNGSISADQLNAYSTIALSMVFSFIVFSYLLAKGRRLGAIVRELGLSRKSLTPKNIVIGAGLFAFVLLIELLLQEISQVTGIPLPTNVNALLASMPLPFLVFSFLIVPINEEILFRGFLVSRIGIIASALLFAIPHLLSYSSVSELVAAFAFGIAAGYVFKKTGSLYPSIFVHMLVNLIAILPFL